MCLAILYDNYTDCAIEMYLGKHDAYSILIPCKRTESWQFFPVAIGKYVTSCGGRKCSCIKLSCPHECRSINTLRLLILPNTCSKVRNSVFDTHCTVDTPIRVHTGGHADAISEIHEVTASTTF